MFILGFISGVALMILIVLIVAIILGLKTLIDIAHERSQYDNS